MQPVHGGRTVRVYREGVLGGRIGRVYREGVQ